MNWTEPPFDENLVAEQQGMKQLIRRLRDLRYIGRELAARSKSKKRGWPAISIERRSK